MDLAPTRKVGKREADDAVETEVVSVKKQKVEENVGEIKIDTIETQKKVDTSFQADDSCSMPEQCIEVKVSGFGVHVVSMLEDKSNVLEEDTVAAEKKPVVASEEGHVAVAFEIDEPNDDADSCLQDETSLDEDVAAAPPTKKDESSKDSDVSPDDSAFLDEDVTAANLSPPPPSTEKSSVSIQEKDDSRIHEFDYAHETNNDDSVDTAQEGPPGLTEKDPVVSWIRKDESCSDSERPNKITAESTSSVFTEKEEMTNEELELDDETSSSDDDPQTPATPTEQTSGGKTLYVGNLSFSVEQEDVEHFFKAAGEVVDIRFAMNSDETFKGYGYVEFASAEAAEKALRELNGKELLHRRARLDFVKERGSFTRYTGCQETESFQKGGKAQGQTVFVRGFSKSICQDEIRKSLEEHFSSCGEVSRVSVPKDQDGSVRGIAYIDFKERDAFIQALALNGSEFRESNLSVIEAKPRVDSHDNAGSGRCYQRNGGRYGLQDFSGRGGRSNFGGRSGWQDLRGRSDICETGAWSGAGVWGESNGKSASCDANGRGVWGHSNGRGASRDSSGRGAWHDSSGRGVWGDSSGRGASCNSSGKAVWGDSNERDGARDSSGRGGWGDSNERGAWGASSGIGAWEKTSSGRGGWGGSNERGAWEKNSNGRGFGGQSNGRGASCNPSGRRGDWGASSGRGAWGNSSGRGAWGDSCEKVAWGDSSGRGASRDSSGRGTWGISSGRGASCDSSGRGNWGDSSGRGTWGDSSGRGVSRDSSGRGNWSESCGRVVWGDSSGRGAWGNSSGRGAWSNSSGRGNWGDSSGRGAWGDSSGRCASRDFSGRGNWGDSSGRGAWVSSSGRGASRDFSGRGNWGDSSRRGAWGDSSGRGAWGDSSGSGAPRNSSGRGVWGDSNERGAWWWCNFRGRGAWRGPSGRGVWGNSNGRGVCCDSSGGGVLWDSNGTGVKDFSGSNSIGGTGVCSGDGGSGQGTLINPSIAAPEAGTNTTLNNEGEVEDQIN